MSFQVLGFCSNVSSCSNGFLKEAEHCRIKLEFFIANTALQTNLVNSNNFLLTIVQYKHPTFTKSFEHCWPWIASSISGGGGGGGNHHHRSFEWSGKFLSPSRNFSWIIEILANFQVRFFLSLKKRLKANKAYPPFHQDLTKVHLSWLGWPFLMTD